jgi:hypothetical protein
LSCWYAMTVVAQIAPDTSTMNNQSRMLMRGRARCVVRF